jgi:tetratricopeptide (TPR) repeat protein
MKSLKFAVLALAIAAASPAAAAPQPDLARAQALLAAGEYGPAGDIYDAALARDPTNLAALLGGAKLNLQLESFDRALLYAQAAVRVSPQNADALVARGLALAGLQQNDKARADFDKVLAQGPHAKALEGRAWLWADAGDRHRLALPAQVEELIAGGDQRID